MSGTVGNYQQGAFTSPTTGQPGDASVVLGNDNNVRSKHNSHDADATIHVQSSVLASRPAAGTAQRVWVTTDGFRAYLDDGANWQELAYLSLAAGGAVAGAVTLSSTLHTVGAATFDATMAIAGNATTGPKLGIGAAILDTTFTLSWDATNGAAIQSFATKPLALNPAGNPVNIGAAGSGATVSGTLTATAFSGPLTGDVTGNVTGNVTGAVTGNASTATKLATARNINGVAFDGSADVTVPAAAGTLTGTTLAATVVTTSITSVGVLAAPHMTSPVIDSGGLTVTAGGLTVTAGGLTVTAGGLTVTAGNLAVSAGTMALDDGSHLSRINTATTFTITTAGATRVFATGLTSASCGWLFLFGNDSNGTPQWASIPIGHGLTTIAQNSGQFNATKNNPNTVNVYVDTGSLTLQNNDAFGMTLTALLFLTI